VSAGEPRTFGVEEELVLIDPATRRATARSDRAEAANDSGEEVALELFQHQVESSTPPLSDAGELGEALRRGRRALGEAAAAVGARAVATAAPPLAPEEKEFTRNEHYLRFEGEFGQIARDAHVCGMHVHVEIADEDEGIRVIDGIRPWLPLLTAISANSPYWQGTDTGYASWRSQVWGRWSSAGARERFGDVDTYRDVAERMIAWGGALDPAMLYFDARLSESYPTVELRVCDVCLEAEDAVLVAVLARALVATAAEREPAAWRSDLLRVAGWRAARHGTAGDLVHPGTRELASPREVFTAMLEHVGDQLDATAERRFVEDGFDRLLARGNGAVRQRRTFEESHDLVAVVDDLADATEATWL
jgi:glutamate---cysteine ligase / carboxylate-amine ligase